MSLSLTKHNYISHLIGLLICVVAISDITRSKEIIVVASILCIWVLLLCFPIKDQHYFKASMLFVLFLIIMSLVNLFFTINGWGGSLTLLTHSLLAYLYIQFNSKLLTLWVVLAYFITIGFIAYNLFILNTDANDIYPNLSRNHAGFAVVFWSIFLLFHIYIAHGRIIILVALLGLILSFFLFGRTSLLVSALLLLIVFFFKFKKKPVVQYLATGIFLILCFFLWVQFESNLVSETNLDKGLDTPRWRLWGIYLEHITALNFFTGVDVSTLPMYDIFTGNPHNSFIKFHSRVGFGAVVFIILILISFFKFLKLKNYYVFWLLFLLSLRAFFDSDILIGNFDFIYFIITFYWIKNK